MLGLNILSASEVSEIMGCGKPIIEPLCRESADILPTSRVTLLILAENPGELDNAIKVLKGDPEKCRSMGQTGWVFVEKL